MSGEMSVCEGDVCEGDVGQAAWPSNRKTTKTVQWPRSLVVEVHALYYVVAKIDKHGNPIYADKWGAPQTWRVSYDQFKPDKHPRQPVVPPIPDEIVATVLTVKDNVASFVCSKSEPDADVIDHGLPHGSTPPLLTMAPVVFDAPESDGMTSPRGVNLGSERLIQPVNRLGGCSKTAAGKRGRRASSTDDERAGNCRVVAQRSGKGTGATASRSEPKKTDIDDDGESARIAFRMSLDKLREWREWRPPKEACANRKRALVPAFLVFSVGGVMVRLDWVHPRLFGREMHNPGKEYLTQMLQGRNLKTELKRSADDTSMIYVTFERPCKGWIFREAWTADPEQPQKLSQFVPPSEHDAIGQMPMFKFE